MVAVHQGYPLAGRRRYIYLCGCSSQLMEAVWAGTLLPVASVGQEL